jgi:DNA uptake protein ComE-like DNA-binding protein
VAGLVAFALLAMAGYLVRQWRTAGGVIDVDHASPLTAEYRVDINSADWPELSQLPEIGETLARRIIEARATGGPFQSNDDMQRRVPGLGPKTLERIRPYLEVRHEDDTVGGG